MKKLTENILYQVIKKRPEQSYKGTYGRVLIIGGTKQFGGAAIMNALASVHSGAGLVTVATDPSNFTALHSHLPEAMVVNFNDDLIPYIQSHDVILIGSGLGDRLDLVKTTFAAVSAKQIMIVDGSALTLVAANHLVWPTSRLIITPHQMEWQRVSDVPISQQTFEALNSSARAHFNVKPIVVLKQFHTQIYTDNGSFELTIGGPYQATGGMGDTLAGIIAGFVAQFSNTSLDDNVLAAVYIHSAIADELAQQSFVTLPTQISAKLPYFMKKYAN
ncbi:NAD(P)H-hydrate dehydratase [Leuconostoc carnosum]|uniref:NAD(P)H-hydrate dehydratase n=1 Tax=Leuconostoc carnosum TaxID=1252 RepID=UPI001239F027|nr:NAD(P)H-hydrate dehydratase [Leuconostoc carnosum]KAA8371194.1 NAD(P)H-hydrate dehydratase [Leuconostoc carnosum]KAA8382833.1 NAD(P)H-hydrate dehydratase [Leuconostoc carnosum]